jgi:uracil-DNA glycosylase
MATTFTFDKGPNASWTLQFFQAPRNYYLTHPSGRFRIDYGPVYYRGRLGSGTKVLIVGQDPSTDELLAQRNLVGSSGQKVQKLLNKIGINKSYVMFNTFLFGIRGQMDPAMNAIAVEPTILNYRNSVFDKVKAANTLQAIISFGNGADIAIQNWPGKTGIPWFQLHHPSATDSIVLPNWNASLTNLHTAVTPDKVSLVDLTPYGTSFTAADFADIPREDLPFAPPDWHGTGGLTHSGRNGDKEIQWFAP